MIKLTLVTNLYSYLKNNVSKKILIKNGLIYIFICKLSFFFILFLHFLQIAMFQIYN